MRKMGRKMQPTWHRQSQFQTRDEKQTNYDEGKLDRLGGATIESIQPLEM